MTLQHCTGQYFLSFFYHRNSNTAQDNIFYLFFYHRNHIKTNIHLSTPTDTSYPLLITHQTEPTLYQTNWPPHPQLSTSPDPDKSHSHSKDKIPPITEPTFKITLTENHQTNRPHIHSLNVVLHSPIPTPSGTNLINPPIPPTNRNNNESLDFPRKNTSQNRLYDYTL